MSFVLRHNIQNFAKLRIFNPLGCRYFAKKAYFARKSIKRKKEDKTTFTLPVEKLATNTIMKFQPPYFPILTTLALNRKPIFPGATGTVQVSDAVLLKAIHDDLKNGMPYFAVFLRKSVLNDGKKSDVDSESYQDDLCPVGTLVQIQNIIPLPQSTVVQLVFLAHRRISLVEQTKTPYKCKVSHWSQNAFREEVLEENLSKAYFNETLMTMREIVKSNPLFREQMEFIRASLERVEITNLGLLADFAAMLVMAESQELQAVLEERCDVRRLRRVLELLKKEVEFAKIQQKISENVEQKLSKQQRDFMLWEQLKSIKKELGLTKDDQQSQLEKFENALKGKDVPEHAMERIKEEMDKFRSLEKNSAELNVTRNYLEWMTCLPWSIETKENFSLEPGKKQLDEDHYGLEDVKRRILEFIAVGNLRNSVQGKILCLIGPPGVGKTSIAKSIAAALGRKFFRFSVGGLTDVAEIKGHRRTYVGAMPGKLIQCLKLTQASNPIVLIDEIDKIGRGYQGDPSSALLEILDPSQNSSFTDHYLDLPVDLSKILFITTANVLDTIPEPLRDRMEILRIAGYDQPEKVEIAKRYLIPKIQKEMGLTVEEKKEKKEKETDLLDQDLLTKKEEKLDEEKEREREEYLRGLQKDISIDDSAINLLIRGYCRESGVRYLEKQLEKIMRKIAFFVVAKKELGEGADEFMKIKNQRSLKPVDTLEVTSENLERYVGPPIYTKDRLYSEVGPPGVVMGLAWTANGGSVLYMESTASKSLSKEGVGTLTVTGRLGDVMKESTQIALSVAKEFISEITSDEETRDFLKTRNLHVHVPEGATPKDGPSAGITLVTSFLSLALKRKTLDVAMTGEVSLTGRVLPIGGLKEKTIAARRAGIVKLIFPEDNRRDFEELPDYLKDGLEVHYAKNYSDVFSYAF